jgi:hypothetical protein
MDWRWANRTRESDCRRWQACAYLAMAFCHPAHAIRMMMMHHLPGITWTGQATRTRYLGRNGKRGGGNTLLNPLFLLAVFHALFAGQMIEPDIEYPFRRAILVGLVQQAQTRQVVRFSIVPSLLPCRSCLR